MYQGLQKPDLLYSDYSLLPENQRLTLKLRVMRNVKGLERKLPRLCPDRPVREVGLELVSEDPSVPGTPGPPTERKTLRPELRVQGLNYRLDNVRVLATVYKVSP